MPKQTSRTSDFKGFQAPRYTQVPDELFDKLLPELSGAELKVLLYIIRRTFGFKRDSDNISLSQMLHGIQKKDGEALDYGVGLSKKALLQAINSLEAKNMIITERRRSIEKGDEPTSYRLNMISSSNSEKTTPPVGKKVHQGGGVETPPGPWGKKYTTQETVLQDTEEQETDPSNIRIANQDEKNDDAEDDPSKQKPIERPGFKQINTILPENKSTPKPRVYDEDRQIILEYIQDFGPEFSDQASLKSSTTRAYNLFKQSGLSLEDFIGRLYEARAITKERTSMIRSSTKDPKKAFPTKNKMAYFFACLEEKIGLREPPNRFTG